MIPNYVYLRQISMSLFIVGISLVVICHSIVSFSNSRFKFNVCYEFADALLSLFFSRLQEIKDCSYYEGQLPAFLFIVFGIINFSTEIFFLSNLKRFIFRTYNIASEKENGVNKSIILFFWKKPDCHILMLIS